MKKIDKNVVGRPILVGSSMTTHFHRVKNTIKTICYGSFTELELTGPLTDYCQQSRKDNFFFWMEIETREINRLDQNKKKRTQRIKCCVWDCVDEDARACMCRWKFELMTYNLFKVNLFFVLLKLELELFYGCLFL